MFLNFSLLFMRAIERNKHLGGGGADLICSPEAVDTHNSPYL